MADKKGVLSMVGDVTAAQATLFQKATRGRSGARKRRRTARAKTGKRRTRKTGPRRTKKRRTTKRLTKGSPAAKRRMAQLRRMQKR